MLNISSVGPTGPVSRKSNKPVRDGMGFHLTDPEHASGATASGLAETPEAAATAPPSRAETPRQDRPELRDRAASAHGQETLKALAELQRDMLAQTDNPAHLDRLAELSAQAPEAATAGLRSVLRQVAVRAQVELARHEVARGNSAPASDA